MRSVTMRSSSYLTLETCPGSSSCLIIRQVMMELLNIWLLVRRHSMKQMLIKEESTSQEVALLTMLILALCFSKSPRKL